MSSRRQAAPPSLAPPSLGAAICGRPAASSCSPSRPSIEPLLSAAAKVRARGARAAASAERAKARDKKKAACLPHSSRDCGARARGPLG